MTGRTWTDGESFVMRMSTFIQELIHIICHARHRGVLGRRDSTNKLTNAEEREAREIFRPRFCSDAGKVHDCLHSCGLAVREVVASHNSTGYSPRNVLR